MKTLIQTLGLIAITGLCHANEQALDLAKLHLKRTLNGNHAKLSETYSGTVKLMPGHEFLKKRYGINKANTRSLAIKVEQKQLIAAMIKASAGRGVRDAERVEQMLKTLNYEVIKTTVGDHAIEPSDPVGTPDKKLHFLIQKDDVLLKVSPPKGDFLLLHLRQVDEKWRVVSEYLD